MVKSKDGSYSGPFQKWIPLSIVEVDKIPNHVDENLVKELKLYDLVILGTLMEVLCTQKNGVGLSAFQVGIPIPFFIASEDGRKFQYFYECEYSGQDEMTDSIEGCLSLLDNAGVPKRYLLKRHKSITCKGKKLVFEGDVCWQQFTENYQGFMAIVMQHEIDHHLPRLICDIGKEVAII